MVRILNSVSMCRVKMWVRAYHINARTRLHKDQTLAYTHKDYYYVRFDVLTTHSPHPKFGHLLLVVCPKYPI